MHELSENEADTPEDNTCPFTASASLEDTAADDAVLEDSAWVPVAAKEVEVDEDEEVSTADLIISANAWNERSSSASF